MLILESLPTVIGTAAIAPALLMLWLVVAAGERPEPPAKVWTAFLLGAASISLLGVVRAPFLSVLTAPDNPWLAQALHSLFSVALPEEAVKILVIAAVSARRRPFADPLSTVVYGAAAGLGFAAYENLAYLVQHADMWQSLAALRSVLTVPFHGALGIIAGAYLAIARSGTALGAHRHHRDRARISSRILICWRRRRCTRPLISLCSPCRETRTSRPPPGCCWDRRACSSGSARSRLPRGGAPGRPSSCSAHQTRP